MFDRLKKSQPDAIKKVILVAGDVNTDNLGLKSFIIDNLAKEVNIVFHMAATLRLEANLNDALEQNTKGTARVIEICRKMMNLEAFLHFSTAFCSADISIFEERVGNIRNNAVYIYFNPFSNKS